MYFSLFSGGPRPRTGERERRTRKRATIEDRARESGPRGRWERRARGDTIYATRFPWSTLPDVGEALEAPHSSARPARQAVRCAGRRLWITAVRGGPGHTHISVTDPGDRPCERVVVLRRATTVECNANTDHALGAVRACHGDGMRLPSHGHPRTTTHARSVIGRRRSGRARSVARRWVDRRCP
jgi:hypothetical protein